MRDARPTLRAPIVAYHIIFATYGFWLPNDPRGSWSDFVGAWELCLHGRATKTLDRRSLARVAHDRTSRLSAKRAMQCPPVIFNGLQARAVARGFANYLQRADVSMWACAVMPDHVHLVLDSPRLTAEQVVIQLKGAATRELELEGIHPLKIYQREGKPLPKCFVRGEWKVYLHPGDVRRAIRYVQNNPLKAGMRAQRWAFVSRYAETDA